MQFIINDSLLDNLMNAPESLAQSLIQVFLEGAASNDETADIVLDISKLVLQSKGLAVLNKLSEFVRYLINQQIPVAKIIVEDSWLKNPLIIKANDLLNKLFPGTNISIYGVSGQPLYTSTYYVPTMMMPTTQSGDAPYSFYPDINMTVYNQHIAERIAAPFTLNQGKLDACGVTAYLMQVLETQPELYKKLALELVEQGKSESVVSLYAPEASKLTKSGVFRSSSSAVILNAFQNPLSFFAQIGIPVEIVGWLDSIVKSIIPNQLSDQFDTFKMYALDGLSGKLANLPRQIVHYLSNSGYEVTKETAKMLPMEFFKDILSKQKNNPDAESIIHDIQRLTYSDIHTESSRITIKSELEELAKKLKKGYQALLLLESKWNWKITGLEGIMPEGLSHYNYCKDFHLYLYKGRERVNFTIYTWGNQFKVDTKLTEFARHYCGIILSKPKALLFSKEITKPAVSEKTRKRYPTQKTINRGRTHQAPQSDTERGSKTKRNNADVDVRERSPKRRKDKIT